LLGCENVNLSLLLPSDLRHSHPLTQCDLSKEIDNHQSSLPNIPNIEEVEYLEVTIHSDFGPSWPTRTRLEQCLEEELAEALSQVSALQRRISVLDDNIETQHQQARTWRDRCFRILDQEAQSCDDGISMRDLHFAAMIERITREQRAAEIEMMEE
jgi:hypothetical protein